MELLGYCIAVRYIRLSRLDIYLDTVGDENRTLCRFDFDTIKVATENFSTLCLRHTQIGPFYKGRLQNGQDIAILEWSGYFTNYECHMNEASSLVKLEHKNLMELLGYCIAGARVYFVYDFAPHTSLDYLINGSSRAPLDWDERYKTLLGVAEALVYLHKLRIIHSNVNLYNILFDESLVLKLCGFGYSRCFKVNEPDYIVVDENHEARGYMAPEYLVHGRLSTKADVFSFGYLILLVVFWREYFDNFVKYRRQLGKPGWKDWLAEISSKISVGDSSLISRCIHIALLCLEEDANERPSMEEVIGMLLNTSSDALPLPKKPVNYGVLFRHWINWAVEELKLELSRC